MKFVALVLMALLIVGCSSTKQIVDQSQFHVIEPPQTLMKCPLTNLPPNTDSLTNQEVANLIDRLYRNNRTCHINMNQIIQFVNQSRAEINLINEK